MLDEIRSWFLKINNTDNPLVKLIQNRREKNTNYQYQEWDRGYNYRCKDIKRKIREYYKQL